MSRDTIASEHIAAVDPRTSVPGTLTPEQKSLRATLAAHHSWARTPDRKARTAAARQGRWQRYLDKARDLHPGAGVEVIQQAAEHLRRADMVAMAYKSSRSRSRKAAESRGGSPRAAADGAGT